MSPAKILAALTIAAIIVFVDILAQTSFQMNPTFSILQFGSVTPTSIVDRHMNGAHSATDRYGSIDRRVERLAGYRSEANLNPFSNLSRFNGRYEF
jgi:hypothetical protein